MIIFIIIIILNKEFFSAHESSFMAMRDAYTK